MIWLNGNRHSNEHERFDCVEIVPASGGAAPIRFEAENMRLNNSSSEQAPFAQRRVLCPRPREVTFCGGTG
jgi:hypothetical protein